MTATSEANQETLASAEMLVEQYRSAWESDRHLTSLNWQIASIVFAGIAAGFGLNGPKLGSGSVLVSWLGIIMTFSWFLFVRRNRDISDRLLEEARKLEQGQGPLTRLDREKEKLAGPPGFITVCILVWSVMSTLGGVILKVMLSVPVFSTQFVWFEVFWMLLAALLLGLLYKPRKRN